MSEYSVESCVLFSHEKSAQMVEIMDTHGEVTGTAGGFPLGPMCYSWEGSEEGAKKLKDMGASVSKKGS